MRLPARIAVAVVPPALAAVLGSRSARTAPEVYRRLDKPDWAPPEQVFGPVWTVLYALIGTAGWRLTRRPQPALVGLHLSQLGLNAAWTPLFFGAGRRRAAVAVSVALDVALVAEILALARRDRAAAALLVPYLAWTGYATALATAVTEKNES